MGVKDPLLQSEVRWSKQDANRHADSAALTRSPFLGVVCVCDCVIVCVFVQGPLQGVSNGMQRYATLCG